MYLKYVQLYIYVLAVSTFGTYGYLNCSDLGNVQTHSVLYSGSDDRVLSHIGCIPESQLALYGCAIPVWDQWIYVSLSENINTSKVFDKYFKDPTINLNINTYCTLILKYLTDKRLDRSHASIVLKRRLLSKKYESVCAIDELKNGHEIFQLSQGEWRTCEDEKLSENARCALTGQYDLDLPSPQPAYCLRMNESTQFQQKGFSCQQAPLLYGMYEHWRSKVISTYTYECSDYDGETDDLVPGVGKKYGIEIATDGGRGEASEIDDDYDGNVGGGGENLEYDEYY